MVEQQLQSAGAELRSVVASLDVDTLSGPVAVEHLSFVSSLESVLSALKVALAARVEASNAHVMTSHTSASSLVAEVAGVSSGEAASLLKTGKELASCPSAEQAFASGEITLPQASEVARGASVSPSSEASLLDVARNGSAGDLKREAGRAVASSGSSSDQASRSDSVRKRRYFRFWDERDGSTSFRGNLPNEDWARMWSVLKPGSERQFRAARKEGRREDQGAYQADALVEAVTSSGQGKASKPVLNVVVDHDALKRGHLEPGEVCEVPGVGPVPVSVARELFDDCVLRVLVTKGQDILSVASETRYVPRAVQSVLDTRQPVCSIRGCDNKLGIEQDHRHEMHDGGVTSTENLAGLCRAHHHLKTHGYISLKGKPGDYEAVPTGKSRSREKSTSAKRANAPPGALF